MSAPLKKSSIATVKGVDEQERLARIQTLWEQLAKLRENSAEYKAMVRQIRKEADGFQQLVESRPKETEKQ